MKKIYINKAPKCWHKKIYKKLTRKENDNTKKTKYKKLIKNNKINTKKNKNAITFRQTNRDQ